MVNILFVVLYSEFDDIFELINKVENDRIVLILGRLIVAIEPHLTSLNQQPDFLIHGHEFGIGEMFLLIADEYNFGKRL